MAGRPGGLSDVIARQLERQMGMNPGPIPRPDTSTPVVQATPEKTGIPTRSAADFVQRHTASAKAAEAATGIPATFMVAQAAHESGWGKKEIRKYLFDNTKIGARWLEHYPLAVGGAEIPLADHVKRGSAPALYTASNDPNRLVPMLLKEEWTNIVVAGDPGRNQSRIYVNNHEQGPPVARKINLPKDWRERIKSAKR